MKLRKSKGKQKKEESDSEAQLETPEFAAEKVQPTFREHYPLFAPYSRAAIVEDAKGGTKYLLLEPTLTPFD